MVLLPAQRVPALSSRPVPMIVQGPFAPELAWSNAFVPLSSVAPAATFSDD